jgi:hypothetical protein
MQADQGVRLSSFADMLEQKSFFLPIERQPSARKDSMLSSRSSGGGSSNGRNSRIVNVEDLHKVLQREMRRGSDCGSDSRKRRASGNDSANLQAEGLRRASGNPRDSFRNVSSLVPGCPRTSSLLGSAKLKPSEMDLLKEEMKAIRKEKERASQAPGEGGDDASQASDDDDDHHPHRASSASLFDPTHSVNVDPRRTLELMNHAKEDLEKTLKNKGMDQNEITAMQNAYRVKVNLQNSKDTQVEVYAKLTSFEEILQGRKPRAGAVNSRLRNRMIPKLTEARVQAIRKRVGDIPGISTDRSPTKNRRSGLLLVADAEIPVNNIGRGSIELSEAAERLNPTKPGTGLALSPSVPKMLLNTGDEEEASGARNSIEPRKMRDASKSSVESRNMQATALAVDDNDAGETAVINVELPTLSFTMPEAPVLDPIAITVPDAQPNQNCREEAWALDPEGDDSILPTSPQTPGTTLKQILQLTPENIQKIEIRPQGPGFYAYRSRAKMVEIPRLRARFREKQEQFILKGRFDDCVMTTRRQLDKEAQELGLSEDEGSQAGNRGDLLLAAVRKITAKRKAGVLLIEANWIAKRFRDMAQQIRCNRNEAATKIQRWFRNRWYFIREIHRRVSLHSEQVAAAIKIQAAIRGFLVRKNLGLEKEMYHLARQLSALRLQLNVIPTRQLIGLQAIARGGLTRCRLVRAKAEAEAAATAAAAAAAEAEELARLAHESDRSLTTSPEVELRTVDQEFRHTRSQRRPSNASRSGTGHVHRGDRAAKKGSEVHMPRSSSAMKDSALEAMLQEAEDGDMSYPSTRATSTRATSRSFVASSSPATSWNGLTPTPPPGARRSGARFSQRSSLGRSQQRPHTSCLEDRPTAQSPTPRPHSSCSDHRSISPVRPRPHSVCGSERSHLRYRRAKYNGHPYCPSWPRRCGLAQYEPTNWTPMPLHSRAATPGIEENGTPDADARFVPRYARCW